MTAHRVAYCCRESGICSESCLRELEPATLRMWLRPHRSTLAATGFAADGRSFPTRIRWRSLARSLREVCATLAPGSTAAQVELVASIRVLDVLMTRAVRGDVLHRLLSIQTVEAGVSGHEAAVRLWIADPAAAAAVATRGRVSRGRLARNVANHGI